MEANSFDILLTLIKGSKNGYCVEAPTEHSWAKMGGSEYLLGQALRQISCKQHRHCVSKAALDLWKRLGMTESIFKYSWQKPVFYQNTDPVKIGVYNGAHGTPFEDREVQKGDQWESFKFREVFHEEHIVPISVIKRELFALDLNRPTDEIYNDFDRILGNLSVCRMLKSEDRKLNKIAKKNRPCDIQEIIDGIYKDAGIEIVEWKD